MLTDRYELTMLGAALRDGTASRHCSFEVFGRRLPDGRRYGVVGGTGRLLDAIAHFSFADKDISTLLDSGVIDSRCADYLADYRFTGDVDGYAEGEPWFPYSPMLTVTSTFAEAVVLETLVLSVLNHDCAIAAAAARMSVAAGDRAIIDMGSRRTHEAAAIAAARIAYVTGFAMTSNLAAGKLYGIPTAGTAAHAFMLLHDDEEAAFASQLAALGSGTTLLVDTYDITKGIETAVAVAGPSLGAIRIDSGDLAVMATRARTQLDTLGADHTRIVVSGDLDEFSIAALAAAPVDIYGVGTSMVTGSGAPTAGLVYKLVEVDGRPVQKRSENKGSRGGRKVAWRRFGPSGLAIEDRIALARPTQSANQAAEGKPHAETDRALTIPLLRSGARVWNATLEDSRAHHRAAITALPWEAVKLSKGEPGLPVVFL